MIDFKNTKLESLCVHHVGNKTNGEDLLLSKSSVSTSNTSLINNLHKYFLSSFNPNEAYGFTFSNNDFTLNPIFNFALGVFSFPNSVFKNSIDIAKLLYEMSTHPQIKAGNLFVAYFTEIRVDDVTTQGLGIFKAENKQAFITVEESQNQFHIDSENGFNINKLDKGCLILNTDRDNGFKVFIVDNPSKSHETIYWRESFLNIKPSNDVYHQTKDFLNFTKTFVVEKLKDEYDINRTEQIDLLNRSVEYFKTNEQFDKSDFENEVLVEQNIIKTFRSFDQDYCTQNDIALSECFEISPQAVKKQARYFKSILKLDGNFHVYIHGNKDMIERGVDDDGRKYYKLFYEEES